MYRGPWKLGTDLEGLSFLWWDKNHSHMRPHSLRVEWRKDSEYWVGEMVEGPREKRRESLLTLAVGGTVGEFL